MGMIVVKFYPSHHRIVRISQPNKFHCGLKSDYYNFRTEIFDSETWSWKQVHDVSVPFGRFPFRRSAVSAGGSLYWPITGDKTIIENRQEDNYCSTFSLPEEIYQNDNKRLMESEGRVGVLCGKGGLIELWVMKKSEKKVWSKRLLINCEDVRKEDRFASCLSYYGSDVALFGGIYQLILYNMKKKSTEEWRFMNLEDVFQFQSDYEPVNVYQGSWRSHRLDFLGCGNVVVF